MKGRNKILVIFWIVYLVFVLIMWFVLKVNSKNKFSEIKLQQMISGKSKSRDTTTDLCKYQILGDPTEIGNYVKIGITCADGRKVLSTVSLSAIPDKTVMGFVKEYSRIIGFDEKLLLSPNVICKLDNKVFDDNIFYSIINPKSNIDCVQISK